MQRLARGAGPRDGTAYAEEYPTIETHRFGLCTEHNLLRECWNIIHSLWHLPTPMAGIAGDRLFADRSGVALGGCRELFGEQEI